MFGLAEGAIVSNFDVFLFKRDSTLKLARGGLSDARGFLFGSIRKFPLGG